MERIKVAIDKARQAAGHAPAAQARPAARTGRPPVALVPGQTAQLDMAHLAAHRIVSFERSNPLRWSFDLLRTQVLQKMKAEGWRTLAITSPTVQSGKTVVAINLAMSIAHHPEHSAMLVDFDLRRPQVGAYLGLAAHEVSLPEVLSGAIALQDAAVDIGLPGLAILPTHRSVAGAAEVLESAPAVGVIETLRSAPDGSVTLFDLPPVTAVDDVIAVLPRIDCVLLVIGNGTSTKRDIQEAQRHLAGANVVGYVLNKAAVPVSNAGYY